MTTAGLLLPSLLLPSHEGEKPEPPVFTESRAHKTPLLLRRLSPTAALIIGKYKGGQGLSEIRALTSSPVVMWIYTQIT